MLVIVKLTMGHVARLMINVYLRYVVWTEVQCEAWIVTLYATHVCCSYLQRATRSAFEMD